MTYLNKKLKISVLALLCLGLFIPFGFSEEPKPAALSLKDVIKIAFKNNKDIHIEEKELEISQSRIMGARSDFIPKANFQYGYTHNAATLHLSTSGTQKKDTGVLTGYKNDNLITTSITETIYNGGANIANFKQAQLGLRESQETLRAKKADVEFEAKRLYYGLLLAYENQRIAQELVDQAQAHYEDVENKFKQGTSSRFDLLQSKVQVSLLMPELVKAKNDVDLTAVDLKKLLGFKINDPLAASQLLEYSLIEIKEAEFLKAAYLNKPEMILSSLGIDINKWSIEMAKAGWRPQINANGSYIFRSNNWETIFDNRHTNWQLGASLSLPIFDAWSTRAKVDEAKAKYAQALLSKDNLTDQIAADVRQACLDLNKAKALIDSQKDNVEEAREALKISIVSYDNGVGTNLNVLDSQASLAQVQQNLSQGIYDYLMAEAFLDRTMGKSILEEAKNEKNI
jgi:outer membrane protein TolC